MGAASAGLANVATAPSYWGDAMNKMIPAAFAAALLLSATGCTEAPAKTDPIEGTWKADLATVQLDEKPSVYLLKDGTYSCSTCVPALTVPADGAFHPVSERPYYDNMSVQVVDDRTVKTVRRKGDRVIGESTVQVAPEGNSLSFTFSDTATPNAPPVTGSGTETRVEPAPAGSHAISGSWKTAKYDTVSDEGLTVSYDVEGDTLNMSSPSGQKYAAKLDGADVPVDGDTGGTVVSVKRLGANMIEETFKRDGKIVGVTTMTVNPDGTLTNVYENRQQGSKMTYVARKQ